MSSITFQNDAVITSRPTVIPNRAQTVARVDRDGSPMMHEDDTAALRTVSAIIFAVVVFGTLAMLATVLLCL